VANPLALALAFGEQPFPATSEPWVTEADLVPSCLPVATGVDVASFCFGVTAILRNLCGGRYGIRRQTVRPHTEIEGCYPISGILPTPSGSWLVPTQSGYGWWSGAPGVGIVLDAPASVLEIAVDGTYLDNGFADGAIVSTQAGISSPHAAFTAADVGRSIVGPGIPTGATVASVQSSSAATMSAAATVSGTVPFVLPARTPGWYLYDRRLLVRANGVQWPASQDLSRPLTSPGSWGILYESGTAVPVEAKMAARALACELIRGLVPGAGACAIPDRVNSLTRQGSSLAVMDPNEFLKDGWTGVRITDLWLASLKARRSNRRASILGPDNLRGARQ
jgi:hypothetical protein